MKYYQKFVLIIAVFLMASCKKEDPPEDVVVDTIWVSPNETNEGYSTSESQHLAMWNPDNAIGKLVLFIGGTYSSPDYYQDLTLEIRNKGYYVINISYPNNTPAASLKDSDDVLAFDHFRQEICYGDNLSDAVTVAPFNSIVTRAEYLLTYLNTTYPSHNWGQFINGDGTIKWSAVTVSGHSQGAGHAGYLAKQHLVERVVMFSGPNDYSEHFEAPGTWLSAAGETPVERQYVFLHAADEVVPYAQQFANIQAMGIIEIEDTTVLMDDLSGDYENANAYHTELPAISKHGATVGQAWKIRQFHNYLFRIE